MGRFPRIFGLLVIVSGLAIAALGQDGDSSLVPAPNQGSASIPAQVTTRVAPALAPPSTMDQVIDRIVEREHFFTAQMKHMHPLAETYIQNMKADKELGMVPTNDQYFLGRLDLSEGTDDRSFLGQPGFGHRVLSKFTSLYSMHFLPLGFA